VSKRRDRERRRERTSDDGDIGEVVVVCIGRYGSVTAIHNSPGHPLQAPIVVGDAQIEVRRVEVPTPGGIATSAI